MGNWTTSKKTTYFNVRLISDAKHFPASGEGNSKKHPATFLTIVDGTKNGEDIFVDAKVQRGAEKLAGLRKGQEVTVTGTVEFSLDRNGKMRGKIWDAAVELGQAVREALKAADNEAAAKAAADAAASPLKASWLPGPFGFAAADAAAGPVEEPADDGEAPAFE
jgi:hypothetical protein